MPLNDMQLTKTTKVLAPRQKIGLAQWNAPGTILSGATSREKNPDSNGATSGTIGHLEHYQKSVPVSCIQTNEKIV